MIIPEMVEIRSGAFLMGSPEDEPGRLEDEGPQHWVDVPAFAIGRYPVTFYEYDAFYAEVGRPRPDDFGLGRGRCPVINISWFDAVVYCECLSQQTRQHYRLLSEAEWEYACRAGTQTRFSFWGDEDQLGDYAWFSRNSGGHSHPVGQKQPNPWGIYDMHGNVWEWVQDAFHPSYEGAPTDGSAWVEAEGGPCVLRGGSWYNEPRWVRGAARGGSLPHGRLLVLGFRLARTLP